jgi:hypothetical protein
MPSQYSPGINDPANAIGISLYDAQNDVMLPGKTPPILNDEPPATDVDVANEALAVVLLLVFVYPGAHVVQLLAPFIDCPLVIPGQDTDTDKDDKADADQLCAPPVADRFTTLLYTVTMYNEVVLMVKSISVLLPVPLENNAMFMTLLSEIPPVAEKPNELAPPILTVNVLPDPGNAAPSNALTITLS